MWQSASLQNTVLVCRHLSSMPPSSAASPTALERLAPPPPRARFRLCRRVHLARRQRRARRRPARQPRRHLAPARRRPGARPSRREHPPFRPRAARQQRTAVGRARHGQVVARQGGPCRDQPREGVAGRLKLVEIHREDIEGMPALMTALCAKRPTGSSSFATTCRSTPATPPISRSKPRSRAGSRARPPTSSSTRPPTAGT